MSIPRFAIQRPVMMSMISAIIILLGGISLTRLPVDLLPDIAQPTINVRVNYSGVGPLEMEELVTRPLEQQLSAVSGVRQMNSTSSEGNSQIQMNFEWGHDLNEAMDDIRTRIDRVRGRLPEDADPPVIQKFDPNSQPILRLAVESMDGSLDRVALRELSEQTLSPRLERVYGVAAVTVDGGLRRQIHVELSREKTTALDLSVDRVVNVLRTENQNIPIGEIYRGDRSFLMRSQGQFENLEQIQNLVVLTKAGVPIYLKDIADVTDSTEDIRSVLRINGRPGVRLQVTKQSGTNTVQIAQDVRAEIERINREVPGVRLTLLQDNAKFIERAIAAVSGTRDDRVRARDSHHLPLPPQPPVDAHRRHVDPDLGRRHLRAALLRRHDAEHDDVRRAGARRRHGRRRRDRRAGELVPAHGAPRQGSGDRVDRGQRGSVVGDSGLHPHAHRRLRAAALPDRCLERHVPAAVGGGLLLAGDVAVRGRHARAGALFEAAEAAAARWTSGRACSGSCPSTASRRSSTWTTPTAGCCTRR